MRVVNVSDRSYTWKMRRSLPVMPRVPGLPILGNLLQLRRDRAAVAIRVAREFGDIAELRAGVMRLTMITSPELVHELLVEKVDDFIKAPGLSYFAKPLLGEGLLTSERDFHKKQRRMMSPMFLHKRIASYAEVMVERTARFAERLRDGQELDVSAAMMALTLEIVGKTLFDAEVGDEAEEIGEAVTAVMEHLMGMLSSVVPTPRSWPTPSNLRNRRAIARLDETIFRMIRERRREGVDKGDLLSMLLLARDEAESSASSDRMDDQQVRDEAMTLFLAGHETTANALSWAFYLLSQNPAAQERMHREIDALEGATPTLALLERLPYTLAVFKEAIRLYPPAYVIGRLAVRDTTIGGYRVPKRSVVVVGIIGMHRRPSLFADPDRFEPERFLPEREKTIPKYAYLPFGAGPRICIGNHFALMEGHLLLATLAQRVRFEVRLGLRVEAEPLVTLRPKGGIPVQVRRRDGRSAAPHGG